MAGDWIKWTKGLTRKREVVAIASRLEISRREVASTLMEVWEWADDNTVDCHVPSVTKAFLDELTGVTGIADAMENERWLLETDSGISFPNFERHNGQTAKERALASNRQKRRRDTVTKPSRSQRDKGVTREEKRREEKSNDHLCSWNGRTVKATHLKDWCSRTFGGIAEGRGQKQLSLEPLTRDLLFRVGVLRLCDVVSEAFVEHGCEGLRKVKRWPANPGGWLRTTWSDWEHAPANLNQLLGEVELPDGI